MALENLEIIDGEAVKENLRPEEKDILVGAWLEAKYHDVNDTVLETQDAVQKALAEKKEAKDLPVHLDIVMDEGGMVIARVGGEIAGMMSGYPFVYKQYTDPEKTNYREFPMLEIGKVVVIPKFRNNGVYRKMREKLIANLRMQYGDLPITGATRNHTVKELYRSEHWLEMGFDEYSHIHGKEDAEILAKSESSKVKGWTAFLHVPASLKQKSE